MDTRSINEYILHCVSRKYTNCLIHFVPLRHFSKNAYHIRFSDIARGNDPQAVLKVRPYQQEKAMKCFMK